MKTALTILLSAGLILVPSAVVAQDDFSGRWVPDMGTQIQDAALSPFAAASPPVLITQTADGLAWETHDGRKLAIRLNEPSVVSGRTYTARWVNRSLLLEARTTLPDGRVLTMLQVLLRNANGDVELLSFLPLSGSNDGTKIVGLVHHKAK